jgi:uncharacterized Zn finger protein (UPF0148 family)
LDRFVRHEACEKCGSSDAKAVYSNGNTHCFSCEKTVLSEDAKAELKARLNTGKKTKTKPKEIEDMEVKTNTKPAMTPEENAALKAETSNKGNGFRGIEDHIYSRFGVRHAFSAETREVIEQYYPCTQDGELVEVAKCFKKNGGVITEENGHYIFVEVDNGSFMIHRMHLKMAGD